MRFLLSLLGPQWRLWLIVAGLSLAVVVMVQVYGGIYDKGAQDAINKIEELNDEIEDDAIEARDARGRCFDTGGLWDFVAGRCVEAGSGGGD